MLKLAYVCWFIIANSVFPHRKKMMMLPKVHSALAFMPAEFGWTMWFRVNSENLWATSARFGAEMNFRRGMCLVNWFFSQGVKLKTQHGTSVIWSRFRLPASSHPPALPLVGWKRGWFHRRTSGSYRAAAEPSKWRAVCYFTAPNPTKTGTGSSNKFPFYSFTLFSAVRNISRRYHRGWSGFWH